MTVGKSLKMLAMASTLTTVLHAGGLPIKPRGTWVQSTVVSGLPSPVAVAADASGNVYVTDQTRNQVLKEALSGTTYTQSIVAEYSSSAITTGAIYPNGVAVDSSGNVFSTFSTQNYNSPGGVFEQTPISGGGYTQTLAAGGPFWNAYGVAVDANNNLYVSSVGSTSAVGEPRSDSGCGYSGASIYLYECIFEEQRLQHFGTPPTYSYALSVNFDTEFTNYLQTFAVAVDISGNVYWANAVNGQVIKSVPSTTGQLPSLTTIGTIASTALWGVAVDSSGNVYVVDNANNAVYKEVFNGSTYTQTLLFSYAANGLNAPKGIAVNAAGTVIYIVDSGNGRVLKETYTVRDN